MKISSNKLEITPSDVIYWADVQTMRLANDRLALLLTDNTTIELSHLSPLMIDRVFRCYESYLKDHPELKNKKPKKPRRQK